MCAEMHGMVDSKKVCSKKGFVENGQTGIMIDETRRSAERERTKSETKSE